MLECREYSYQELCSIFNTHDARSIKNRLTRWNVEYTYKGRGANLKLPFRTYTTRSECSVSLNCLIRPRLISENWLIFSITT